MVTVLSSAHGQSLPKACQSVFENQKPHVKRIFDPVHRFIELSHAEARLLDLPAMQRLRRLRQLGLAYFAFPSAEHSRFTHALGALAMGTRAFDELVRHAARCSGAPQRAYSGAWCAPRYCCTTSATDPSATPAKPCSACGTRSARARFSRCRTCARASTRSTSIRLTCWGSSRAIRALRYPALRELVSGPNLDADRMDYLLRDAYFTGVVSGRYDADQLVASLRLFERDGAAVVGIDSRGVVALESFVVARYMMFASVYFHHTTRLFERILQDALRELWPDPHALDAIDEFLRWDDFRVLNELRESQSEAARALRERVRIYALAAEFNAEGDLRAYRRARARCASASVTARCGPTNSRR